MFAPGEMQPNDFEVDVAKLEETIHTFYACTSNAQAIAHHYLTAVQTSRQAWQFAWQMLATEKSVEVQFYAATTLHTKLMKHWKELPEDSHIELKEKLLQKIVEFAKGPKIVLNRLCLAMSAFIVNVLGKEWPTAIEDTVSMFQSQQIPNISAMRQAWILIDILAGIPEETSSAYAAAQRALAIHDINKRAPFVLGTVCRLIQLKTSDTSFGNLTDEDYGTLTRAAKCCGAWLKAGHPLDQCKPFAEMTLTVIQQCYWNNKDGDGCMSSEDIELAEACLESLVVMMVQPDASRYINTALELLKMFLDALGPILDRECRADNLNEDITAAIYTLFISSVESQNRILLSGLRSDSRPEHRELYQRIIQEILRCTNKPGIYPVEESCSTLAMGFWFMLQDEVVSLPDETERAKCLTIIQPLYSHLTRILVNKMEQPNDETIDLWGADDLETFRCYRQDISDTLNYCYDVIGDVTLVILGEMLDESLQLKDIVTRWPKIEAVIFAFSCIAEHVDMAETQVIPRLMATMNGGLHYENMNPKLMGTALEALGSYSEWLKENTEYLPAAINLIMRGLASTTATTEAAITFKEVVRECQQELRPHSEPLLDACQQCLASGHLGNDDAVRLIYVVGKLMSLLTPEKIIVCLNTFVSPSFEDLQRVLNSGQASAANKKQTIFRLNMISTLYASLNTNPNGGGAAAVDGPDQTATVASSGTDVQLQPVLTVMQQTMPICKQICHFWFHEIAVMDALCEGLHYALQNLVNDFKPMLTDLCYLIGTIFQAKCLPPCLNIARLCITMFYRDDECRDQMQQLFVEVIRYTIMEFERVPSQKFSEASDVVEAFYFFNMSLMKKLPQIFVHATIDKAKLVYWAMRAMTMPENGPVKCSVLFLAHFVLQSRNIEQLTATILVHGEEIVTTSLMCIAALTPRAQVEQFADLLLSLNKKYPTEYVSWLKILLMPSYPATSIKLEDKTMFMNALIKEKVNKRLVQSYIREFASRCRGLPLK